MSRRNTRGVTEKHARCRNALVFRKNTRFRHIRCKNAFIFRENAENRPKSTEIDALLHLRRSISPQIAILSAFLHLSPFAPASRFRRSYPAAPLCRPAAAFAAFATHRLFRRRSGTPVASCHLCGTPVVGPPSHADESRRAVSERRTTACSPQLHCSHSESGRSKREKRGSMRADGIE